MTGDRLAAMEVRSRRLDLGLSPEQLGYLVGVSGKTIRRIEEGATPTPRVQYVLARHFGMRPTELWRLSQTPRPPRPPRMATAA